MNDSWSNIGKRFVQSIEISIDGYYICLGCHHQYVGKPDICNTCKTNEFVKYTHKEQTYNKDDEWERIWKKLSTPPKAS